MFSVLCVSYLVYLNCSELFAMVMFVYFQVWCCIVACFNVHLCCHGHACLFLSIVLHVLVLSLSCLSVVLHVLVLSWSCLNVVLHVLVLSWSCFFIYKCGVACTCVVMVMFVYY